MIPRIGQRGHSFKGAGRYFLHDKKAETKDRVVWTHTHNVPTEDPELAMKWMAHTAMNRNRLKQEAGVPNTGRKGNEKPVYHFSLAWQPEQEPQQKHMMELAFDALELLGLKDHEAVFVAHNDTAHPHVHVITNLVNPQNGKTTRPQNDRLRFSTWAEAYEKEHGKIYCEERVINNERRRKGEKVKHREVKIDHSLIIQNLYNQSDSSKAFQAALEQEGFTLAKGDRRGYVLVDEQGKITSLSRQLKDQRAKDIKERLGDLKNLPNGQNLSDERQYFLRDQYETDRQKKIVDAAIEEEENRKTKDKNKPQQDSKLTESKSFAEELDEKRKGEFSKQQKALREEQELRKFYNREAYQKQIDQLQIRLKSASSNSEKQSLKVELEKLQMSLSDIDKRMKERGIDPLDPKTRDYSEGQSHEPNADDISHSEEPKKDEREELRKQIKNRNKDRGDDFDLGR